MTYPLVDPSYTPDAAAGAIEDGTPADTVTGELVACPRGDTTATNGFRGVRAALASG